MPAVPLPQAVPVPVRAPASVPAGVSYQRLFSVRATLALLGIAFVPWLVALSLRATSLLDDVTTIWLPGGLLLRAWSAGFVVVTAVRVVRHWREPSAAGDGATVGWPFVRWVVVALALLIGSGAFAGTAEWLEEQRRDALDPERPPVSPDERIVVLRRSNFFSTRVTELVPSVGAGSPYWWLDRRGEDER